MTPPAPTPTHTHTLSLSHTHTHSITCCQVHSQSPTHKSLATPTLLLAQSDNSIAVHQFKELPQDLSQREQLFEDYLTKIV